MLRKGRSAEHKQASLDVVPYLKKILEQNPSSLDIVNSENWDSGKYSYRSLEYLLRYESVLIAEKGESKQPRRVQVLIRIVEEIRYPKDWSMHAMLTQLVQRRLVLKSAYHKKPTNNQPRRRRRRGRRHMLV